MSNAIAYLVSVLGLPLVGGLIGVLLAIVVRGVPMDPDVRFPDPVNGLLVSSIPVGLLGMVASLPLFRSPLVPLVRVAFGSGVAGVWAFIVAMLLPVDLLLQA